MSSVGSNPTLSASENEPDPGVWLVSFEVTGAGLDAEQTLPVAMQDGMPVRVADAGKEDAPQGVR